MHHILLPGLVITSMLLIWLAGIACSASVMLEPNMVDGLPLIRNWILVFPISSTLSVDVNRYHRYFL